jgi:site-specific DNA-methyltransferase (adenine-specific)
MIEDKILTVDPNTIIISDDRPRQRKDIGEIAELVKSMQTYGQIQPIVVNRNMELVAGGRRLAACLLGNFQAKICFSDEVDPLRLRELELEENIQRKALTPAEEVMAVDELVTLRRTIYGEATPGREGGYTLAKAASDLGRKSESSVLRDLQLADAIKQFPNLTECKTKSEIEKAVKGLQRVSDNMAALVKYEDTIKKSDEFIIVNRDAIDYLKGLGDNSIDLFFTDPPYGIDIHDVAMTLGGETGGELTTTGTKYDDSEGNAKQLLEVLATESYRITKPNGHVYLFCAPSHFYWLRECMSARGWLVAPRPFIWIKRDTGQNNQPERWFSAAYEFVLFARKTESKLILQGRPDWVQCNPVLPSERVHQAEKPVELCKELISRTCLPGSYVIDPCMGSGAIIEAAVQMKCLALGCEKDIESYATAVSRMNKLMEKKI